MQMKRKIALWILIVAVLPPGLLLAQVATVPNANAAAVAANAVIDTPAIPVQIVAGRSTVLDIGTPITRVSLTNADIADALVTSASQLLLHGKTPGTISMFVWEKAGGVRRYDISVGRDIARLSEQVKQLFPGETIQITPNGRDIVVSGTVPTKEVAEKVISLAGAFVEKKEEVVNLLQVQSRPSNQVLLKVRFAEVSRAALVRQPTRTQRPSADPVDNKSRDAAARESVSGEKRKVDQRSSGAEELRVVPGPGIPLEEFCIHRHFPY
jgi:pilus assembly protein CpaC